MNVTSKGKKCSRCGEWKPIESFPIAVQRSGVGWCNHCNTSTSEDSLPEMLKAVESENKTEILGLKSKEKLLFWFIGLLSGWSFYYIVFGG